MSRSDVESAPFDLTRPVPAEAHQVHQAIDVGTVVDGKYRLERLLGRGAMGSVFLARHELLEKRVALKFISEEHTDTQGYAARFLNEARAAAGIESEHVARILDAGQLVGGAPFMVLEMLDGSDLAQLVEESNREGEPIPIERAVDWVLQALEGLAEAHSRGIVHRDLKPANLFLANRRDGTSIVKVLDFGISKVERTSSASPALTMTSSFLGSPVYMPPEQLRDAKSVDARADLWSLGVVLYELLTGALPFDGGSVAEIFVAVLDRAPVPLRSRRPDVPRELEQVVMRCLARDVDKRYLDAAAMAEALAPFGPPNARAAVKRIRHVTRTSPLRERLNSAPAHPRRGSRIFALATAVVVGAAAAVALVESGIVSVNTHLTFEPTPIAAPVSPPVATATVRPHTPAATP